MRRLVRSQSLHPLVTFAVPIKCLYANCSCLFVHKAAVISNQRNIHRQYPFPTPAILHARQTGSAASYAHIRGDEHCSQPASIQFRDKVKNFWHRVSDGGRWTTCGTNWQFTGRLCSSAVQRTRKNVQDRRRPHRQKLLGDDAEDDSRAARAAARGAGAADLQFYEHTQFFAVILFLGTVLELADRVTMKPNLEIAREIQSWLVPSL